MQTAFSGISAACGAYPPHVDEERGSGAIEIVVHYPEDEEGRRELARRAALVHAQTIAEKVAALSCPVEQKAALYDAIIKRYMDGPG